MTRRAVALAAEVSERHLANLEYGTGNVSVLVLLQVASALQCSLAELLGDVTTTSPEWLLIRELLSQRSEADLRRARLQLVELFGEGGNAQERQNRIALIGLRGAGKTALGQRLADDLGFPFIELSREIEQFAGCQISEIHNLYGANAYRRYERRALEEAIQIYPEVVIATPGGLVSDSANFNVLLSHCTTVTRPTTWAGWRRKATCAPWPPAARPWKTSSASWRGERPFIRKPTWPSTPAAAPKTRLLKPCERRFASMCSGPPEWGGGWGGEASIPRVNTEKMH
jgi:transcriptional regulator with XRE-family HTH domain